MTRVKIIVPGYPDSYVDVPSPTSAAEAVPAPPGLPREEELALQYLFIVQDSLTALRTLMEHADYSRATWQYVIDALRHLSVEHDHLADSPGPSAPETTSIPVVRE